MTLMVAKHLLLLWPPRQMAAELALLRLLWPPRQMAAEPALLRLLWPPRQMAAEPAFLRLLWPPRQMELREGSQWVGQLVALTRIGP